MASATPSSSTVTSSAVGLAVSASGTGTSTITLGGIALGSNSISAYGSTSVSVPVYINSVLATVPMSVTFTSLCVTSGQATLSSPVTTIGGNATSAYTDNGCGTTDTIRASVTGATNSPVGANITVAAPTATNIQFVSATPSTIGTSTASSASLQTSSVVKFMVVNASNIGVKNQTVNFSVIPASKPGGLKLSASSGTTDSSGNVSVSLIAGTVPTPVWVVATLASDSTIKSQSNTLTITTGLPTQNFFSLSVSTFNIEGWAYDGVTSTLTVIASDRLGNPVPDGTAINFITEGSQVKSPCSTTSGTCSTIFTSSASRPTNGRVTVLAYALGEKSFDDLNGNNAYDSGETFYDIGDPYIDANENNQWDSGETYIHSSTSGSSACVSQDSGTIIYGYENVLSKTNTCTGSWGQNYVRRNAVIVLSGSDPTINSNTFSMGGHCLRTFIINLYDVNGNPMPGGTTLALENNNITFKATTGVETTLGTATVAIGSPVPNTNALGGTNHSFTVSGGNTCSEADVVNRYPHGTVDLVITTPKGTKTTFTLTVSDT